MNRVFDSAYERLKSNLIASTGLAFYVDRDQLLRELIDGRLSALGLDDCAGYAQLLADSERGTAEMHTLIAKLTNGETSFFRDEEYFAAIRDVVVPDILERKRGLKQLRIWSAGCASGAEPYSLAILLADDLADRIAGWQVEIYATDLNRSYLASAAEGKFRPWALRSVSERVKRDCFSNEGLIWTIHPRYKEWISFQPINLATTEFSSPWPATRFDLILCRNVMIYFAPEVNRSLVGRFHQSLDEQGWLVVGGSEHNLENYQAFRPVSVMGATLYQKTPAPCSQIEPAPAPPPKLAAPRLPAPPIPPAEAVSPGIEGLRQLVDQGDWQSATEYGRRLLAQDRLNPAIHFYQALIFENLAIADEAERSLRRAIYLDRNFALAHYHLALVLQRDGKPGPAARSFENVLQVLAGLPGEAMVTVGHGVTVTHLAELAKMHLQKSSRTTETVAL